MSEQITDDDLELLGELGVDASPQVSNGPSAREQRILAGFEEIVKFARENGRAPAHGEDHDIFERLYAVRLDRIRESEECREVLKSIDDLGLLDAANSTYPAIADEANDEEILAALGIEAPPGGDVTKLVHVRSREDIRVAEEIATRTPCPDFDAFRPMFESVQRALEAGERQTVKYKDNAEVMKGDLFILDGRKVVVADWGEGFVNEHGRPDRRLRVVYDNGVESDLLLRSLQRALNKDKTSRRIIESDPGPLFSETEDEDDLPTGYVYVLRSESKHPFIEKNRSVIHKIGVTGGEVKSRVANAKKDPTYLLAGVEIVATYRLSNVNRKSLEALLQMFFSEARLDLELKDRFGSQVEPKEWFLVPLPVIDDAIQKIKDGTIGAFRYDPEHAILVPA